MCYLLHFCFFSASSSGFIDNKVDSNFLIYSQISRKILNFHNLESPTSSDPYRKVDKRFCRWYRRVQKTYKQFSWKNSNPLNWGLLFCQSLQCFSLNMGDWGEYNWFYLWYKNKESRKNLVRESFWILRASENDPSPPLISLKLLFSSLKCIEPAADVWFKTGNLLWTWNCSSPSRYVKISKCNCIDHSKIFWVQVSKKFLKIFYMWCHSW